MNICFTFFVEWEFPYIPYNINGTVFELEAQLKLELFPKNVHAKVAFPCPGVF